MFPPITCFDRSTGSLIFRLREKLRPFYGDTGRPSIDPELMIRMLIIGCTHGIGSERRLCEKRCTSTSPIAGSAVWVWMARFPTTGGCSGGFIPG